MSAGMQVEAYRFADAERLRFGKYPVLDTILYRWTKGIEEAVFQELGLEAYAGASVVDDLRFGEFFRSLKHARPIYTFAVEPFPGLGLLVLDNRFADACIDAGRSARRVLHGAGSEHVRMNSGNQVQVQRVVQRIMERFDAAWSDVQPVRSQLRRVTTYLFRARLFGPYEQCLVAQLHLSGEHLSARLMLCVPRLMLTSVLERLQRVGVMPSLAEQEAPRLAPEQLLGPAVYEVGASLGSISATLGPEDFRVGSVFPLDAPSGGTVALDVNGTPLFVGEIGDAGGQYAVRVTGSYRAPEPAPEPVSAFRPITWPSVSPS